MCLRRLPIPGDNCAPMSVISWQRASYIPLYGFLPLCRTPITASNTLIYGLKTLLTGLCRGQTPPSHCSAPMIWKKSEKDIKNWETALGRNEIFERFARSCGNRDLPPTASWHVIVGETGLWSDRWLHAWKRLIDGVAHCYWHVHCSVVTSRIMKACWKTTAWFTLVLRWLAIAGQTPYACVLDPSVCFLSKSLGLP